MGIRMETVALLTAFLPAFLVAQTTGDCDLVCLFNTSCVPGEADFRDHPRIDGQPLDIHTDTISHNGYHCACPDGLTGLKCGRTYIGCQNSDHQCYNGGECIPGVKDRFGNEQEFCDCTKAVDQHGTKHVGKYCEIPVPTKCGDDDEVFCVNGGFCKDDFANEPHRPCRCGSDFDGTHCEYKKGQIPECALMCENKGQCKLGIKSYHEATLSYQSFWENTTEDFMHCLCPQGYFGLHCEINSEECGKHHCFNGGTCVTVENTLPDGSVQVDHHCDCTTANNDDKSYGGRFCQYESSHFCEKNRNWDGQAFCVNSGQCEEENGIAGCDCPDGFHGPICEFADEEENGDYEDCNLVCSNGGKCRKGVKDVSFLHLFNLGPVVSNLNTTHNVDFEHCVCPDGYVGLTCDIKLASCGNSSHICLYGSKCIDNGDGARCDCSEAFTSLDKFAGDHCQHKATEFCTSDGDPGTGVDDVSFCVNNAKCTDPKDGGHNGCTCPDGFSGDHCEKVGESMATSISSSNGDSNKGSATVATIISVCVVAFAGTIFFGVMVRRKRSLQNMSALAKTIPMDHVFAPRGEKDSAPQVDVGPEKDLDGNELENVELV